MEDGGNSEYADCSEEGAAQVSFTRARGGHQCTGKKVYVCMLSLQGHRYSEALVSL